MNKYLKIPYKWDGRGWDGVDCLGIMILWYAEELGIHLLDYKHGTVNNQQVAENNLLLKNACNEFEIIKPSQIKRHDIVLIKSKSNIPNHLGICLGNGKFIHAMDKVGVSIGRIASWRKYVHGYYRYKGLDK